MRAQCVTFFVLGVTESDWRLLGDTALKKLNFDLARQVCVCVCVCLSVCLYVCLSVTLRLRACARASLPASFSSTNPPTQAFIRVRDVRTVTFIKRLEAMKADPRMRDPQLHALIHCFNGNFTAASQAYCSIGMHAQAIEMFSELRM